MESDGDYILLAALWILFYAIHSLLASTQVKRWVYGGLPGVWRYYRLLYNLLALAGLVAVFSYQWSLPEIMIMQTQAWSLCLGALTMFAGLAIGGMAFLSFNKAEFIGLQQLSGQKSKNGKLVTTGLYSLVRHPLYFALILIITGYLLYSFNLANLIFVLTTLLYLIIGTKLEEKKLVEAFGRDYIIYRKKVRMLIPFLL